MDTISYQLERFEGPLDLLLTLISKHKLNIFDISIFQLVQQYLLYMEKMQQTNMEVASEFLEMAARLVLLKSLTLLPKHEEEAKELKTELEGQLLEYRLIQLVASALGGQYVGNQLFVREPMPQEVDTTYHLCQDPKELALAYLLVSGKKQRRMPPPASAFSGIVHKRLVSVDSRIIVVLHRLYTQGEVPFLSFFADSKEIGEKVATFLALLELVREGRVVFSADNKMAKMFAKEEVV